MAKIIKYANTTALMESVADKQMVGKAEVVSIVNQLFECMVDELSNGNSIRFDKLGTFSPTITGTDVVLKTNKACRVKLVPKAEPKKRSK